MKDSDQSFESKENDTAGVTNFSEGKADICVLPGEKVFYNPVQEFNRDTSVAVLTLYSKNFKNVRNVRKASKRDNKGDIRSCIVSSDLNQDESEGIIVLEALSASGLRSIRYAKEVPGIKRIIANDISHSAVKIIERNVDKNNVASLVETSCQDASLLMYLKKAEGLHFDAIDIDPYGCPSRFLDAAVQTVGEDGLLLITCTDMAILAGNSPETCYVKYGSISLKTSSCHEMALRIALQCIEAHANRYGRFISPLVSFSADFYIRIIVTVKTSPVTCKSTTSKLSHIYQCTGCKSMVLQKLGNVEQRNKKPPLYSLPRLPSSIECQHCNGKIQMGGPIWTGPLHNRGFVLDLLTWLEEDRGLGTQKRLIGMLTNISQEVDFPLYNTISSLCGTVHCEVIPLITFRSCLLNAGFKVSLSHCAPNSIKTDAPMEFLWDVIRHWVKKHPVSKKRLIGVAENILSKEPLSDVSFDYHHEALLDSKVLRYQHNPAPNWGPGMKAKTNFSGTKKETSVKNTAVESVI